MSKKKSPERVLGPPLAERWNHKELERLINAINNTRSAGEMLALRESILVILIDLSGIKPQNQSVTDGE